MPRLPLIDLRPGDSSADGPHRGADTRVRGGYRVVRPQRRPLNGWSLEESDEICQGRLGVGR